MIYDSIIRVLLRNAKMLKKYTGIETPMYRAYWRHHSRNMQKKLDLEHLGI